jgi:glycosyltransferase involved in cell wall biosynthesis
LASAQRVLIVSEHPYPAHATLKRNVVQLLDEGILVDLLCLAGPTPPDSNDLNRAGLTVRMLRMEHRRSGALRYLWEYFAFFLWSVPRVFVLSIRDRYAAVLVDNLPDFLVFVALIARWRGARVVLEMLELTPELTSARLRLDRGHPMLWVTRWIERIATHWADHVIVVSKQCMDIVVERGLNPERISVVPNTPALALRADGHETVAGGAPFLVTHCSLVERYGVQVAVRALALLRREWPDLTLRVLGEGEYKADLVELTHQLRLDDRVIFRGFIPWSEAMTEIRQAAVGIVAIVADGYGELLLPTKLLEYADREVPVVCARLPTIAHHFPADSLAYFQPGDAEALAAQADRLLRDQSGARRQAARAKLAMRTLSWEALAPRYMAALGVDSGGLVPEVVC